MAAMGRKRSADYGRFRPEANLIQSSVVSAGLIAGKPAPTGISPVQACAVLVGAALAGDGPRSGPDTSIVEGGADYLYWVESSHLRPAANDPLLPVSRTAISVGAGAPAKNQTRRLAPAAPVFAGTPAPTECALHSRHQFFSASALGRKPSSTTGSKRSKADICNRGRFAAHRRQARLPQVQRMPELVIFLWEPACRR